MAQVVKSWLKQGTGSLVGVLVATGLVTLVSAHPGSPTQGIIHACVNNNSGTIKIIDASTTCGANEIALDWNASGLPGTPGVSGLETVKTTLNNVTTTTDLLATASCPAGKLVLGGGAEILNRFNVNNRIYLKASFPSGPTGWSAVAAVIEGADSGLFSFTVYAICANVAP
jgi:hypothetical protein